MMKTWTFLLAITAAGTLGSLHAQSPTPTEKPVPPSGPLIQKKAPDFARWTITARVSAASTPDKAPASPAGGAASASGETVVTVTKTGPVVHVERTDEQRKTWQTWCRGAIQIAVAPGGGQVSFVAPPPNKDVVNPLYFDFSRSDFDGFEWISAQNYTGIKPVLGKNCLVFKDDRSVSGTLAPAPATAPGGTPPPPVMNAVIACVDVDSRLPVALMNDNGVITYQFQKPPDAMQDFPANVQALLDKQKSDILAVKRKPNTPY